MDRRQKRRILIFLLVPILAAILFLTDDPVIRIITVILIVVYVAFIIFLRDSVKFEERFSSLPDESLSEHVPATNFPLEESFEIVSKNKNIEIITSENYSPEYRVSRTSLKPPDLKEKFEEIANEAYPPEMGHDGQFTFVLEKMLTLIKDAYGAHTAIFFWYNRKKEKLHKDI